MLIIITITVLLFIFSFIASYQTLYETIKKKKKRPRIGKSKDDAHEKRKITFCKMSHNIKV